MHKEITIKVIRDPEIIKQYRYLRWEVFRKSSNLPLGSEYYEGEESGIYVGAFINDEFIGGVFMMNRNNSNAQMHQLAVKEKYRGQGVATSLIKSIEKIAKDKGFKRMYAHARSFLDDFYFKKGYALIENKFDVPPNFSTQHQPGVPHVFMRKNLD